MLEWWKGEGGWWGEWEWEDEADSARVVGKGDRVGGWSGNKRSNERHLDHISFRFLVGKLMPE